MATTYSTYEAKSRFSEVMRKVRSGQRVLVAYRGEPIAEIVPLTPGRGTLEGSLARLEREGVLSPARGPAKTLKPLLRKAGALARFLRSRE